MPSEEDVDQAYASQTGESEAEDVSEDLSEDSETSSDSSLQEDSSDEEDEDPADNSVDVTLEFFDPKEEDFQGLKSLLQNFLDGEGFAASELVDTIIKQVSIAISADVPVFGRHHLCF